MYGVKKLKDKNDDYYENYIDNKSESNSEDLYESDDTPSLKEQYGKYDKTSDSESIEAYKAYSTNKEGNNEQIY